MKHIAIIPARSGSKGLKDKNIKLLNGKPLLAYTVEAAIKSGIYDEIHVSTDSEVYGNLAVSLGAQVPFYRSKEASSDTSTSWEVVEEIIKNYKEMGKAYDMISLLQPTSPLRNHNHIREAYELFENKKANAVVSVCEMEHSPLWSNTLPENHSLDNFINSNISQSGRQNLDKYYRINGAIYMFDVDYYLKYKNIYTINSYGYIMDRMYSVDIDYEYDFLVAEAIIKNNVINK